MGRYAVIDIGTNSTKMFVGRIVHGRLSRLEDRLEITRLGEGLAATGELQDSAIDRTVDAVESMVRQADSLGVDKVVAVGTEALRRASNSDEFADLLKKRCKLRVKIIDADREAGYAVEAVRSALEIPAGKTAVFDVGGGSTEIIYLRDGKIERVESLPIGSRLLADEFRLDRRVDPETAEAMEQRIRSAIGPFRGHADRLIGLGGTYSTLGAMDLGQADFDPEQVNGRRLARHDVEFLSRRVAGLTMGARCRLPGLLPERADVMPAGAAIALELMVSHEAYETTICSRGLRHGLFMKSFVSGK